MILFFLLPIILECIDFLNFSIKVNFLPITLATLILWIIGLVNFKTSFLNTKLKFPVVLISAGIILSSFLTNEVINNLTRSIAFFVGLVSSVGFAYFLFRRNYIQKAPLFFVALNVYWNLYVLNLFISGAISTEFHFNSNNQNITTINSHTVSIAISVSSIFIFSYYFFTQDFKKRLFSILVLLISLVSMIISQSRSNVAITIITAFLTFYSHQFNKQGTSRHFLPVIISLILAFFVFQFLFLGGLGDSTIAQRFNFNDTEYQNQTTDLRKFVYVKFWERLQTEFWGTGLVNPKLYLGLNEATNLLMHNQYATWVVAGGWLTLLGVLLFFFQVSIIFVNFFKRISKQNKIVVSLNFAILTYLITLFTVEQSSLLFFIFFGIIIYQFSLTNYK
jgi:hypothetical protein